MNIDRLAALLVIVGMIAGCDKPPVAKPPGTQAAGGMPPPAPMTVPTPPAAPAPGGPAVIPTPPLGPNLTAAKVRKLKATTTGPEVIALFGPPRPEITGGEIATAILGDATFAAAYEDEVNAYRSGGGLYAYVEQGAVLLVGIAGESDPRPGTVWRAWLCVRSGDKLVYDVLTLKGARLAHESKSTPYSSPR